MMNKKMYLCVDLKIDRYKMKTIHVLKINVEVFFVRVEIFKIKKITIQLYK